MRSVAVLLVALSAASASAVEEPLLELTLGVDRTELYVHQQTVLELRVKHRLYARPHWEPPTCEGFWVERLPSIGGPMLHPGGREAARTTVFRRALFPTRTGTLTVPPSTLRLRSTDGEELEVSVPGAAVRVSDLPQNGRPASFSGLVGAVGLRVTALRTEVRAGEAVGVEIDVFGPANVWDADAPALAERVEPPVEVFAERPVLLTSDDDNRLVARRRFRFDLVPDEPGVHRIEPMSLAYFDPDTGAYETARSEPVAFRVRDRIATSVPAAATPRAMDARVTSPRVLAGIVAAALVGVLVTGLALRRFTRRAARSSDSVERAETLLEAAVEARGTSRFAALAARAVRVRVQERHGIPTASLTPQELEREVADSEAVALLRTLEQARFGPAPLDDEALLARAQRYVTS